MKCYKNTNCIKKNPGVEVIGTKRGPIPEEYCTHK